MLEIRNVVVMGLVFVRHNGGWVISSSQLCSLSIPCTDFRARVMLFAWKLLFTSILQISHFENFGEFLEMHLW